MKYLKILLILFVFSCEDTNINYKTSEVATEQLTVVNSKGIVIYSIYVIEYEGKKYLSTSQGAITPITNFND